VYRCTWECRSRVYLASIAWLGHAARQGTCGTPGSAWRSKAAVLRLIWCGRYIIEDGGGSHFTSDPPALMERDEWYAGEEPWIYRRRQARETAAARGAGGRAYAAAVADRTYVVLGRAKKKRMPSPAGRPSGGVRRVSMQCRWQRAEESCSCSVLQAMQTDPGSRGLLPCFYRLTRNCTGSALAPNFKVLKRWFFFVFSRGKRVRFSSNDGIPGVDVVPSVY
jgi:hypothetical protein